MWYTHTDDIPTASAISRTFGRCSSMTILCIFAINSVLVALFSCLVRRSSKLSRPNLNSLVHLATIEYERAESPCVLWVDKNFLCFHTFLYEVLNHCSNLRFFHFHKSERGNKQRVVTTTELQQEHWCATCSLTKDAWLLCRNLAALALTSRGDSKNF